MLTIFFQCGICCCAFPSISGFNPIDAIPQPQGYSHPNDRMNKWDQKNLGSVEPWGNFSWNNIDKLIEKYNVKVDETRLSMDELAIHKAHMAALKVCASKIVTWAPLHVLFFSVTFCELDEVLCILMKLWALWDHSGFYNVLPSNLSLVHTYRCPLKRTLRG